VGKTAQDWIGPDDLHPDDVRDRALYLGHAASAIAYLRDAGWDFVGSEERT